MDRKQINITYFLYSKRASWVDLQVNYSIFRRDSLFNITPIIGIGIADSPSINYSIYFSAGTIFGIYMKRLYVTLPNSVTFYKDATIIEPTISLTFNFKKLVGISAGINGFILIDKMRSYYSRFFPNLVGMVSFKI